MKSKKMGVVLAMVLFSLSVSACNNSTEQEERMTELATESESITEEQTEEETEKETETKKETESKKETQKETETTKESKESEVESTTETKSNESKDNKVTETSKASIPKEDSKPAETTTPQTTEAPKPVHTHNYTAVVTTQPTCTTPGIKTYSCSCGNSTYTESIPCIDHVWQDRYETIHHEAQEEIKQVEVGYSDEVYICNTCGAEFGSNSELETHAKSFIGVDNGHARASFTIRGGQPIYETQVEVIQEAYDETIVVGQTCVNCALTR